MGEPAIVVSGVPTFPPLLSGRAVAPPASALETAATAASAASASAGDVFWSEAVDRLDVAVVLEPDVPAQQACQAHFALMVAFGDALGALAPPEVAVHYRWPSTILINGGIAGRARLALPTESAADRVPGWLVTGVEITILPSQSITEPGLAPDRTSLWDEGCGDIGATHLIESLSRHFLSWIDTWETEGFRPVHQAWLVRAEARDEIVVDHLGRMHRGRFLALDEQGNLLLNSADGVDTLSMLDIVEHFGGSA